MIKKAGLGCGGLIVLLIVIGTIVGKGGSNTASTTQSTPTQATAASSMTPTEVAQASVASPAATKTAPKETVAPTATMAPKPVAPPTLKILKVGEKATLQDQTIVLNSVKRNGEIVTADITITNTGSKSFTVSSIASFEARDSQGYKGSFHIDLANGTSTLDGDIQPNDKLHGVLSYEFPAKAIGLKLYYAPEFLGGDAAVFALDKTAEQEPWPAISGLDKAVKNESGKVYKAGDMVRDGDLVIRLNKVSKQGTNVIADLTVYNAGSKPDVISSVMAFESKDSDGTKGDMKVETGSIGTLDGDLLPGDTLSGGLAYQFAANATGIKLYFNNNLFGGTPVQFALSN